MPKLLHVSAGSVTGAGRSPVNERSEVVMSPVEFLADVEVAVTDRDVVLPRPTVSDDDDGLIAAAGAPPADDRPSGSGA